MSGRSGVRYEDGRLQEAWDILYDDPHRAIALCTDYLAEHSGMAAKRGLIVRGFAYEEIADWECALKDCDQLLVLEPHRFVHWFDRGMALYKLRRNEESAASFDRAVELDADDWMPEYSLYFAALAYYRARNYAAAMARIREIPATADFCALDRRKPLEWLTMRIEAAQRGEPHKFGSPP